MTENSEADGLARRTALQSAVALLAGAGSIGTAAAQEDPRGTSTTSTEAAPSVVVELGDTVRVTDWEQESGTFEITVDADIPSALKITDTGAVMSAMTEGSGSDVVEIPTRGYSVGSDETVIEFAAEEFDGAYALTIASTDGAALIRTDSVAAGRPSVAFGTAAGGITAAAIGGGAYGVRKSRQRLEDDEPEKEVERIK